MEAEAQPAEHEEATVSTIPAAETLPTLPNAAIAEGTDPQVSAEAAADPDEMSDPSLGKENQRGWPLWLKIILVILVTFILVIGLLTWQRYLYIMELRRQRGMKK